MMADDKLTSLNNLCLLPAGYLLLVTASMFKLSIYSLYVSLL